MPFSSNLAMLRVAVMGLVAFSALGAECDAGHPEAYAGDDASLLQIHAASAGDSSAEGWGNCEKKSLIISERTGETYLQWNGALMQAGAPNFEFLVIRETGGGKGKGKGKGGNRLRFKGDPEFVNEHGKPVYGIVLLQMPDNDRLRQQDSSKLLAYLEAGGLLVVSDSNTNQANFLLRDLESSIRLGDRPAREPCSTPEEAPYVPFDSSHRCPLAALTKDVVGLQASNMKEVLDTGDFSKPLFVLKSNTSAVVARAEKKRRLVVIGDDEATDDDCATRNSGNMKFAFGPSNNLQFFQNLYTNRCMKL